jgi:hypothetical protein
MKVEMRFLLPAIQRDMGSVNVQYQLARRDLATADELIEQDAMQSCSVRARAWPNPRDDLALAPTHHRAIKRVTRRMLNFKSFRSAASVLAGIELMHMIRKGQLAIDGMDTMSFADQFYALAGLVRPV